MNITKCYNLLTLFVPVLTGGIFQLSALPVQWTQVRSFIEIPADLAYADELYIAHVGGGQVFCRKQGITFVLNRTMEGRQHITRIDLDFPSPPRAIAPERVLPTTYNIIQGISSHYGLRAFENLRYIDVVPGVDVVFYLSRGQLKYDLDVKPFGRLDQFRIEVHGARVKHSNEFPGAITICANFDCLIDAAPIAYQQLHSGHHVSVPVEYRLEGENAISFRISDNYNPALPLQIDPAITWSTYAGGSVDDALNDVTTDVHGNIYVCGNSASLDFPLRGVTSNRGRQNIIVAKFTADGQHIWSTYFGGESSEVAKAIVCDNTLGLLYVAGWSSSSSVVLSEPFPHRTGGAFDAIILAFDLNGTFVRGTFLGGTREELINSLALRSDGVLIVVGRTNSSNFPIAQAYQAINAGDNDVFLAALAVPNFQLIWSTYYGGGGFDEAYGVACSSSGSVFVTGVTSSRDFPIANALQSSAPPLDNAFIIAFNSSGQRYWATYLGGSDYDLGNRMICNAGMLYVVGTTSSEDFPIVGNDIAQRRKKGFNDAFLTALSETGKLEWSTFWGGNLAESAFGAVTTSTGDILIAGTTSSSDFPRRRSIEWNARGGDDIFCALFRKGLNVWSATLGGSGDDILNAIVSLPSGDIIGVGETRSRDFSPLIRPAYTFNSAASNFRDGFVFRLCTFTPSVIAPSSYIVICAGQSVELGASDRSQIAAITWNSGSSAFQISVNQAGQYWFVATSIDGCTAISDTITLEIAPSVPLLIDTIAPRRHLTLCEGERAALIIRGQYRNIQWFNERDSIIGSTDTLWITAMGTYYAVAVDTHGCRHRAQPHRVTVVQRPTLAYVQQLHDGTVHHIERDTLHFCLGDSVTIDVEHPPNYQCRWSDGVGHCRRVITTTSKLNVTVSDTNGCQWELPHLTVYFLEHIQLHMIAPDTACEGNIVQCSVNSNGMKVQWDLPSVVQIESVSGDSSQIQLRFKESGRFILRAWMNEACTDTAIRTITITSTPPVEITPRTTIVCPGDTLLLHVQEGFAQYVWNGTAGTSELAVFDSGWYRVQVFTNHGCSSTDSVYIHRGERLQAYSTGENFGTSVIGSRIRRAITIANPGQIDGEYTLTLASGESFTLIAPSQGKRRIDSQSQDNVVIDFHPLTTGVHVDTLIIEQYFPCNNIIRVLLSGIGTQDTAQPILLHTRISDIDISPADDAVLLPVYIWSDQTISPQMRIDTVIVEMEYNPTMLLFIDSQPGLLEAHPQYPSVRSSVRVSCRVDSIPTAPSHPLVVLRAAVLLGNRAEDSVRLSRIDLFPLRSLRFIPSSGKVRYKDLCLSGGVRLLDYVSAQPLISIPNPSTGMPEILATPPENGVTELIIYTLQGNEVSRVRWVARAGSTYSFITPLLSSGTYHVIMRTHIGELFTTRLSIAH